MMHAENHDMIRWIAQRLLERGHVAPKFHAVAHDALAESEASNRAIALSRLADVPVLLVHVAGAETVQLVPPPSAWAARCTPRAARSTCSSPPTTATSPAWKAPSSAAARRRATPDSQEAVWAGLKDGTLGLYSSDHAPYRFDASGKLPKGDATTFKEMANGVPGIELRLPLLFSEGVHEGAALHQRVRCAHVHQPRPHVRPGALQGRHRRGPDADLALWNPERERRGEHRDAARQRRLHALRGQACCAAGPSW
jgi:dihydropyrimidinase